MASSDEEAEKEKNMSEFCGVKSADPIVHYACEPPVFVSPTWDTDEGENKQEVGTGNPHPGQDLSGVATPHPGGGLGSDAAGDSANWSEGLAEIWRRGTHLELVARVAEGEEAGAGRRVNARQADDDERVGREDWPREPGAHNSVEISLAHLRRCSLLPQSNKQEKVKPIGNGLGATHRTRAWTSAATIASISFGRQENKVASEKERNCYSRRREPLWPHPTV